MIKRKKIIEITVKFEGGEEKEIIKNDPAVELPEAIFFRDMGVKKILPMFYICEDKDLEMPKAEVEKKWGLSVANTIFGASAKSTETKPIDKKLIRQIWEAPDAKGESTPMLIKIPGCPLG
jgi:hypothetical protein